MKVQPYRLKEIDHLIIAFVQTNPGTRQEKIVMELLKKYSSRTYIINCIRRLSQKGLIKIEVVSKTQRSISCV
jgi:hypothetical protein